MRARQFIITMAVIVGGLIFGFVILRMERSQPGEEHGHGEHGEHGEPDAKEFERGPHRGRMLRDGNFALELSIFETGVPPQFRAYLFDDGKPVPPGGAKVTVELHRLGSRVDSISFAPQGEFLLGNRTVEEPHSFDVKVLAEREGKAHRWEYSQVEGRVEMEQEAMQASGIVVEPAGPAVMQSVLSLNGKIIANEDRLAHIFARFPGMVKEVRAHLGETVKKGETLAIIESNESLEAYAVKSQIDGTIIRKHITVGETVGSEEELFAITDLGTVWADFSVYRQDFPRLRKGQKILVEAGEGSEPAASTLTYLSPIGTEHTQTMTARAALSNRSGQWPPGLFVKGKVVLQEYKVPVAVKLEALQTFRDWDVVFIHVGNTFEARPIEMGRRDAAWVEVLSGLEPGEKYVTQNSFAIKADIGKSGASHDH
jgi:cobalt-zinc-cadmium efflux system membrane fusion protein